MEYQKIIKLLDDTTNQLSKFRIRNWIEKNDKSPGDYNDDDNNNNDDSKNKIKFKTAMIRSSLCNYSDVYILIKGTITVPNTAVARATVNNTNK